MGKAQKLKAERRIQRTTAEIDARARRYRNRLLAALASFTLFAAFVFPAAFKAAGGKLPNLTKETSMNTNQSTAVIQTSKGTIRVALNSKEAPKTVGQFTTLAKRGFYNGLTFHRVEPGFVIQGGDPKGDGSGNSDLPDIPFEANNLKHEKGVIAMARSQSKDSANSQFYITLAAQPSLDGEYVVFGRVTNGQEVVEKITKGDKITTLTVTP